MTSAKKSLLASGLALLASVALLAGTTFAWFTDSVTNIGNRIQAGSLLINAYAYELIEGDTFTIEGVNDSNGFAFEPDAERQDLKSDSAPIINEGNWEPGQSSAKLLKVENGGTLAAKIKLEFHVNDGGLMNALWFDFIQVEDGKQTGTFAKRPMNTLDTFAQKLELPLLEKGDSLEFILIYGMYENAGNEYQDDSFSVDVTILAKQTPKEEDGFGSDQYDKLASYPATSDNAQTVLDDVQNDAIVHLTSGNYSTLHMSQTENSRYEENEGATSNLYRTIKNVTITGDENTIIDGIEITAGHIYGTTNNPVTNPVTGETTTSTVNSYYSYIEIDGLTFKNITFTKSVKIAAWNDEKFASVKNVTFENCTFEGSPETIDVNTDDNKLASFGASGNVFKNIVFRNCTVHNAFQGIYVVNADGVTVENCTFNTLGHNAIAVQSGGDTTTGGTIVLRNNTIQNGKDRAIRFGNIRADADITITGNVMINTGDPDGQLIKCQSVANGAVISINDNYWAGRDVGTAIDSSLGTTDTNPRVEP